MIFKWFLGNHNNFKTSFDLIQTALAKLLMKDESKDIWSAFEIEQKKTFIKTYFFFF